MSDPEDRTFRFRAYLFALAGVAAATVGLALFQAHSNSTTSALVMLLAVLVSATAFGSRPAFFAALLGVCSFNFFFLPPYYTLTISEPQNWVAFAAFMVTALVAGQLSSYARRRAEESEHRRREIERLYDELRSVFKKASEAEALRQSEQLKSALLDAVTHDLRTPLTSIKASVTTLLSEGTIDADECIVELDQDSRVELLDVINEETDRLNVFIGGLVDLARIEAGNQSIRRIRADIQDLINQAAKRAGSRLSGHTLSIELANRPITAMVDVPSVIEVIYTLLDNAAKYSPAGSEIRVSAAGCDGMLEVSVEDLGRGIMPEQREKVFDKFYRVSDESIHSTASGLGLGLAIARGVVESQGGRIWIEDGRDGFRTRVSFYIPSESNGTGHDQFTICL